MLHHVREPLPILQEMRRVTSGYVLVVDQVAPERFEEAEAMHHLEVLRDPSHAATRPPSAFRILLACAGLEIVDERITESEQRMSTWMGPSEFPPERIERVERFLAEQAPATGMGFHHDGTEWVFSRRRIMHLARRPE